MKVLALDVGERRIGLAVGDTKLRLAQPLGVMSNTAAAADEIIKLLDVQQAEVLVVGFPRNLQGEPTQQSARIEAFVAQLSLPSAISLVWQDESLTSVQAEAEVRAGGKVVELDALAASYILKDYLEQR